MNRQRMTVAYIENQHDRLLLFDAAQVSNRRYYVIARHDAQVKIGDNIQYEPYGGNFGFMVDNPPAQTDGAVQSAAPPD